MSHTAIVIVLVATLALWGPAAHAQQMTDPEFVKDAAMEGVAEVELGRLATQRASREAVRQFGQRMVTDHSALNAELIPLAQRKGISVPAALDALHQQIKDRLSSVAGTDFDGAYMQEMVADHTKDVQHFEYEAQMGTDPEVKAFAVRAFPVLQQHLDMARDLHTVIALGPVPPSASPITAVTIVVPTAVRPWCGGAYAPMAGTNFASCPPPPPQ
jgi:putative membrane protein